MYVCACVRMDAGACTCTCGSVCAYVLIMTLNVYVQRQKERREEERLGIFRATHMVSAAVVGDVDEHLAKVSLLLLPLKLDPEKWARACVCL